MKDCTDITLLLDRSGSMRTGQERMEEALNGFITDQKKVDKPCNFSLIRFDDQYEPDKAVSGIQMKDVPEIKIDPRGMTRLLDALGKTINDIGTRLSNLPEAERPSKVLVTVLTDGGENDSKEYTWAKIKEMITHQRDVYSWEFTFIGCDQDSFTVAAQYGIDPSNALNFNKSAKGTQELRQKMSSGTEQYRLCSAQKVRGFYGNQEPG